MITLAATTEDGLQAVAKEYLEERGFLVTKWLDWETPGQICNRLGIGVQTLERRLRKPHRPPVEVIRHPGGRLAQICSNELFDAFLLEGKNAK